jgi:hypothetical protein
MANNDDNDDNDDIDLAKELGDLIKELQGKATVEQKALIAARLHAMTDEADEQTAQKTTEIILRVTWDSRDHDHPALWDWEEIVGNVVDVVAFDGAPADLVRTSRRPSAPAASRSTPKSSSAHTKPNEEN